MTVKFPAKISGNVAFLMHHTAKEYELYFERQMQALKLSRAQWLLLVHLLYCEGTNQKDLGDLLGIGKGAIGKLVHKLEKSGWVQRSPDDEDGRAYLLSLTSDARPIVTNLSRLLIMETDRSLMGFSAAEIDQLKGFMARIQDNITAIPPTKAWTALKNKTTRQIEQSGL